MPKLSYKERERQRREKEILWTAARIIHERGYANLNMDNVAEEVGVSKPTLYQHFKSKDEMVIATMVQSAENLLAHMDSLQDEPPIRQLEYTLRYLLDTHVMPQAYPATFVHEPSLIALESYRRVIEQFERVSRRLRAIVHAGQQQGQIPASIPPMVVIASLFSMLGVLRGPDMLDDHHVDTSAMVEGIVRLFLHGISASPEASPALHDAVE